MGSMVDGFKMPGEAGEVRGLMTDWGSLFTLGSLLPGCEKDLEDLHLISLPLWFWFTYRLKSFRA